MVNIYSQDLWAPIDDVSSFTVAVFGLASAVKDLFTYAEAMYRVIRVHRSRPPDFPTVSPTGQPLLQNVRNRTGP